MFIESPRFPDDLAVFARGGVEYNIGIIERENGYETRNLNWGQTKAKYTISQNFVTKQTDGALSFSNINNFFNAMYGPLYAFRFKDFQDYIATTNSGVVNNGVGTGFPTGQLGKQYIKGLAKRIRDIKKPVVNTEKIFRNNIELTKGTSLSQYDIDYTTGIITFQPITFFNISSVTTGGVSCVVTTSVNHNFTNGQKIYISNMPGNTVLNNRLFDISSVTANTFTIVGVTNLIASNSGRANLYPQPTDFLTASFEFDIPVRFNIQMLNAGMDESGLISIDTIELVEVRT